MSVKSTIFALCIAFYCTQSFAKPVGGRSVPSAHVGYGAIPYSNSGCQVWNFSQTSWSEVGAIRPDVSNATSGTVRWTFPLSALGVSSGDTIRFDVATSGDDPTHPGVDHLSRSDQATDGWGTPSTSGDFLEYTLSGVSGSQAFTDTIGDVFDYPS